MQIFSLAVENSTWFVKIFMIFLAKAFLDGVCKVAKAVKKAKENEYFIPTAICYWLVKDGEHLSGLCFCRANDLDLEPYARTRLLVLS